MNKEAMFQELPPTRTIPACCQQVVNPELASTGLSQTLRGTWEVELGLASYWEHRLWLGWPRGHSCCRQMSRTVGYLILSSSKDDLNKGQGSHGKGQILS